MTIGVLLSTEINERRHASDSDRSIDETFPPDAPEGICDDDTATKGLCQVAGRAIRIFGQKHDGVILLDVRLVNAGIGTNESMMRLADQDFTAHSHNPPGFSQNDFHETWI